MTPVAVKVESVKVEAEEAVIMSTAPAEASRCGGAATLAEYLRLPLCAIDSWSFEHKHMWLKCMLTKHSSAQLQLLDEAKSLVVQYQLAAIDSAMLCSPAMSLDGLLDVVQMKLDCQTADKLRGELNAWRLAARDSTMRSPRSDVSCSPSLSVASSPRRRNRCGSGSGSGGGGSSGSSSGGSGGSSGDLLWEHILRLLMTQDPAVRWLQPQLGLFQFVRSGAAAKSWGRTKSNEHMSFEKMSRSIRQYYRQRSGVIQKVANKARLQYQFNMRHPDVVRFIVKNFPASVQQQQQQQRRAASPAAAAAGCCCDEVVKGLE